MKPLRFCSVIVLCCALAPPDEVVKAANIRLQLRKPDGRLEYSWPKASGAFSFPSIPEGSYLLDVVAVDLLYPQLRIDVSGGEDPEIAVSQAEDQTQVLPYPLVIRPIGTQEYYEKRQPFNLMNFVKTPYGLMILFGAFAIFVLPRLKIDEESEEKTGEPGQVEQAAIPSLRSNSSKRR